MILYHGSNHIIENPKFGFGKKNNDYGMGFYCTAQADMAKEWAVQEYCDGWANCYEIDESGLNILELNSLDYTVLHWITLLLQNRTFDISTPIAREAKKYLMANFDIDISKADIIIGNRADDSYFTFAQDFLNNTISVGQLRDAMNFGDLGIQYVLKSQAAFDSVRFLGAETALSDIYYENKIRRDKIARQNYFRMDTMKYIHGDLYIMQIIDQEVKSDDPRLR